MPYVELIVLHTSKSQAKFVLLSSSMPLRDHSAKIKSVKEQTGEVLLFFSLVLCGMWANL